MPALILCFTLTDLSVRQIMNSLSQWFLTWGCVNKFPGGRASPYAPYNLESLIIKDTNNYVCFYSLFEVRGLETKDNCWEAW